VRDRLSVTARLVSAISVVVLLAHAGCAGSVRNEDGAGQMGWILSTRCPLGDDIAEVLLVESVEEARQQDVDLSSSTRICTYDLGQNREMRLTVIALPRTQFRSKLARSGPWIDTEYGWAAIPSIAGTYQYVSSDGSSASIRSEDDDWLYDASLRSRPGVYLADSVIQRMTALARFLSGE
jgi:hypothetical protein